MSSLPLLAVRGSYYDLGYQAGSVFKERIQAYYDDFEDLQTLFIPFYETVEGRQFVDDYVSVVNSACPQYLEEVKGISDGANIPYVNVILMHLRVEIQFQLGKKEVPECSTIYVNSSTTCVIAHNEDTSASVYNRGYLLQANLDSGEKFIAFCYPGVIPGNSFAINGSGYVFTVNALYPNFVGLKKVPRQFLHRGMLRATSQEEIETIIQGWGVGVASGCSVNVGYVDQKPTERILWNYELCPLEAGQGTTVSKWSVSGPEATAGDNQLYYNHFNMYKHIKVEEMPGRTTSSIHRQASADALATASDVSGALLVLGDTDDVDYPIFRRPSETDSGDTVATAVFDLNNLVLTVYLDNPKTSEPVMILSFKALLK